MRTRWWLAGLCLGLGYACASGDESGTSGRQQSSASRPPSADTMEPTGAAGTSPIGDLGNSDFDPSEIDGMTAPDAMVDACVPGMRCYEDDDPDETDCGSLTLESTVETVQTPGNVLVVYDRSGSMEDDWNGTPKYQAAGDALVAAVTPLQDLLTIGGVFFPSLDPSQTSCACNPLDFVHWIPGPGACCLNGAQSSCIVTTIDQADQINFGPGPEFVAAVPSQWRLQGAGRTPLETGVMRANEALASATLTGAVTVVIVTDGAPNCSDTEDLNVIAQRVSTQVADWLTRGIRTHVIGLPGAQEAEVVLNQVATAGGTDTYINPSDSAMLEMRLREILSETIREGIDSCTIDLMPPAEAPEKLHLVVTESGRDQNVPRELSADASWSITDDGATVTLEGRLCEDAQSGRFEALRFEFGCVDLPPLEPPPPPPEVE